MCYTNSITNYKIMENKNLVAWGIIISLGLAVLTGAEIFAEEMYSIAGIGMFVFGIWAAVILLKKK